MDCYLSIRKIRWAVTVTKTMYPVAIKLHVLCVPAALKSRAKVITASPSTLHQDAEPPLRHLPSLDRSLLGPIPLRRTNVRTCRERSTRPTPDTNPAGPTSGKPRSSCHGALLLLCTRVLGQGHRGCGWGTIVLGCNMLVQSGFVNKNWDQQ